MRCPEAACQLSSLESLEIFLHSYRCRLSIVCSGAVAHQIGDLAGEQVSWWHKAIEPFVEWSQRALDDRRQLAFDIVDLCDGAQIDLISACAVPFLEREPQLRFRPREEFAPGEPGIAPNEADRAMCIAAERTRQPSCMQQELGGPQIGSVRSKIVEGSKSDPSS